MHSFAHEVRHSCIARTPPMAPRLQILRWMENPVPASEYKLECPTPTDLVFPGGKFCPEPTAGCGQVRGSKQWGSGSAGAATVLNSARVGSLPRAHSLDALEQSKLMCCETRARQLGRAAEIESCVPARQSYRTKLSSFTPPGVHCHAPGTEAVRLRFIRVSKWFDRLLAPLLSGHLEQEAVRLRLRLPARLLQHRLLPGRRRHMQREQRAGVGWGGVR